MLDLQICEIKDGYMLVPMSEIECKLDQKLDEKIEEAGTVSSGIRLRIIGGRITQYSDYKNFIAVFERD